MRRCSYVVQLHAINGCDTDAGGSDDDDGDAGAVSVNQVLNVSCYSVAGKARSLAGRFCPSLNAATICGSAA